MTAANVTFYERVEDALDDRQLHEALAFATGRFVDGRVRLMSALPEADALRDHARRIRAHTLANLDRYLAQFADMVEQQGGQVYWAATAEEATRYVVELAQARGVKAVVKSKSMVSEELEINEALEGIGVRAVETDLGEFIIQLAGEKPSHIIAPAIHKSRQDVARLFQKKLNAADADVADVPQMYALARRTLRHDFLQAGMGISGANFGVAETGSICLVTNEGNGRLTTTLPPIHVVMMGIERLLPTTEDLGVLLQILARSATGQKMSVYTNIITGPRRQGENGTEPDGPSELHVVLVDNGRTKILGSELAEILYCIRCGACLNACPVYREIGGHAYGSVYPGPIGSVVTPGLYGVAPWSELPHASSLCGACREACPVRIDIPRMLLKLRDEGVQAGKAPFWLKFGIKLYRIAVLQPALFHLGGRLGSWATRLIGKDGWVRKLPGPLSAWTDSRDFPALAPKSFSQPGARNGEVNLDQEQFLSRIRNSLQHTLLPAAEPEHPGSFEGYTGAADPPVDHLIEDFRRELEGLSGHVYTPADSAGAIGAVLEILHRHQADRIMAWEESYLDVPGIGAALAQAGISIEDSFIPVSEMEREARLAKLDGVLVGLTGAEAGLADTGTIALINGPGRGRLASLLPPVHIALLPTRKLYPSLPIYLGANPQASTAGSNLVFIAGPSRSGDIELALSIGVHGPGEVHVIILP